MNSQLTLTCSEIANAQAYPERTATAEIRRAVARTHVLVDAEELAHVDAKLRLLQELADALHPEGYEIGIYVHATDPRKVAMSGFENSGSGDVASRALRAIEQLKQYRRR